MTSLFYLQKLCSVELCFAFTHLNDDYRLIYKNPKLEHELLTDNDGINHLLTLVPRRVVQKDCH